MQDQPSLMPRIELERPAPRSSIFRRLLGLLTVLGLIGGGAWAWKEGYRPPWLVSKEAPSFTLVEVDRGDIAEYVVEFGTLESASDAVVRCQVEAITGLVGGTNASGTSKSSGATTSTATATPTTSVASKSTTATGKTAAGTGTGASKSGASSTAAASSGGATTSGKPTIRSFTYAVTRYTPLRRSTAKSTSASASASAGGSGSRGGGSRGGGSRGGGGGFEEKPGATRIISILPEGTPVKKGEVVCELDSATFRDELKAQQIRWLQAKAFVEQANAMLAVNEITLREYKEGIYPQDLQQIRQYVDTCQLDRDRAFGNLEWSQGVKEKGLRTSSQLLADELNLEKADFILSEAKGMLNRLESFTGPKILKSLEAKLASIRADKLAQDASFALEEERLRRLEKNVAACTLRAPTDGVVVYIAQTNGWGQVEASIQEGVTVRQDQPIFQLPDPKRMRIKARINETKVSLLRNGQECEIRMDAFPDRPLLGRVADVTAIASPVNGPFSDVRVYFALIDLENAFEDLRPGLSAEVTFLHDRRSQVERVPLASIREVQGESFVAIYVPPADEAERKPTYRWQKVELGLSDADFVEVVSGVRQGERLIADPATLEAPRSKPLVPAEQIVAAP